MSLQGVLRRTPAGASGIRTASHGLILSAPGTPLGKPSIHESNAVESRYSSGACPWPNAQRNSSAPSDDGRQMIPPLGSPENVALSDCWLPDCHCPPIRPSAKRPCQMWCQEDLWVVPFLLRESHRGDITLTGKEYPHLFAILVGCEAALRSRKECRYGRIEEVVSSDLISRKVVDESGHPHTSVISTVLCPRGSQHATEILHRHGIPRSTNPRS